MKEGDKYAENDERIKCCSGIDRSRCIGYLGTVPNSNTQRKRGWMSAAKSGRDIMIGDYIMKLVAMIGLKKTGLMDW